MTETYNLTHKYTGSPKCIHCNYDANFNGNVHKYIDAIVYALELHSICIQCENCMRQYVIVRHVDEHFYKNQAVKCRSYSTLSDVETYRATDLSNNFSLEKFMTDNMNFFYIPDSDTYAYNHDGELDPDYEPDDGDLLEECHWRVFPNT